MWKGAARIQWGCAMMQLLGETNLKSLHLVLSGLRSVEQSRQVAPYRNAVRSARSILGDGLTRRAVRAAVLDFLDDNDEERTFDIDAESLEFQARSEYDGRISAACSQLLQGLPALPRTLEFADVSKHLIARLSPDRRVPFRLQSLQFPDSQSHDLHERPERPIEICWSELRALAADLDLADGNAGRESQEWSRRLSNFEARVATESGLQPVEVLRLDGLRHLIGLPGSGKTTVIILLCILLARRGLRVVVFLTTIQVARDYLQTIRRYGIQAGLLMGRGVQTYLRHANRFAELVAAKEGEGGFALSLEGAELLACSCPLPAFADDWPADDVWRFGEAPCENIREAGSREPKLCPAWSLCGRVKNQRDLVNAPIWLGHIRGIDTPVPAHVSDQRLRYFELISRTFDLVIIDEADEAQKYLDEYGSRVLTLTGNADSLHTELLRTQRRFATSNTSVNNAVFRYIRIANEFQGFALNLVQEIRNLGDNRPDLLNRYRDKVLTSGYLLREAGALSTKWSPLPSSVLSAVCDLWETAMYSAFYQRDADGGSWTTAHQHEEALGRSVEDYQDIWRRLNRGFRQYLALDHASTRDRPLADIAEILREALGAPDAEDIIAHVKLLTVVGFTIANYQRLAREARYLSLRGELPEGDNGIGFSAPSTETRETVPRSILGTYSGVRFRQGSETDGLEIDYLVMECTPRLLPFRLHEMGGTNVLLSSATSRLEQSSQYHVGKAPDILLSPRNPRLGGVRLYFQPKFDRVTGKPLHFSGAGHDRDMNLRSMVSELASPGPSGTSDLERTVVASRTQAGRHRKAALVVNSYEQVRLVVDEVFRVNPSLGKRTMGIMDEMPDDYTIGNFVPRGRVEEIGPDPNVDVLVFPLGAIGRAMNIVFTNPADSGKAAIGSIFFLARPHPASGDLGLLQSIVARETERLDSEDMRQLTLSEVESIVRNRRYRTYRQVERLLARPMAFSQLSDENRRAFAANLLVSILQMVGRGIRRQMPVEVYFVDAAWAPNSAEGKPETTISSTLVAMREILDDCLSTFDPNERKIYQEIYGPFSEAFREIDGLILPDDFGDREEDDFHPSAAWLEDDSE